LTHRVRKLYRWTRPCFSGVTPAAGNLPAAELAASCPEQKHPGFGSSHALNATPI